MVNDDAFYEVYARSAIEAAGDPFPGDCLHRVVSTKNLVFQNPFISNNYSYMVAGVGDPAASVVKYVLT